jgi:DnaJ-class molecular chaperone
MKKHLLQIHQNCPTCGGFGAIPSKHPQEKGIAYTCDACKGTGDNLYVYEPFKGKKKLLHTILVRNTQHHKRQVTYDDFFTKGLKP